MPLRARLQNSGLKLKIPIRHSSSVQRSPYASNRHSTSPGRRGEVRAAPCWPQVKERQRPPSWERPPSGERQRPRSGERPSSGERHRPPSGERKRPPSGESQRPPSGDNPSLQQRRNSGDKPPLQRPAAKDWPSVQAFDASVNWRPVWQVNTERPLTDTAGFRDIPIQCSNDLDLADSSPVSPELPSFRPPHCSPLELQLLRRRHMKDWIRRLSPDREARHSQAYPDREARHSHAYPARYLSSPVPTFRSRSGSPASSVATSNDSILTPTEVLENPLGAARRDSSGVLQSPDVLDPAKEDGFYLLKKDSQRRATLGKILKDDRHRICQEWHSLLVKDVHDFCLTEQHLSTMVDGLKGFIEGSPKAGGPLKKAVQDLRNALDYDGAWMNHLQLALYKVPEALNKVLRGHSIKPHWMFALDGLVRTAVQEAVVILSPELGAHLGTVNSMMDQHQDHHVHPDHVQEMVHDNEGGSTSGVSTVSQLMAGGHTAGQHGLVSSLGRLREENRHLLTDLMKAQESYQDLLRQSLAEQRLHLQMLSQSLAASSLGREPVQRQAGVVDTVPDPELVDWLTGLNLNSDSKDRIVAEDLSLTDMLELMSREDLKGLGLKAGPELRVWRAILTHRQIPLTPVTPSP